MSERTGSRGTFYSLAKWFRWASWIIILAPLIQLIFGIIQAIKGEAPWMPTANNILSWVTFIAGVIWFILIIILLLTAGKVKDQINAFGTRIALLIALVCVLAPAIIAILVSQGVIGNLSDGAKVVIVIVMPIIELIGYATAASTAGRAKRKLA